jgi:hypothetical protein
MFFFKTRNKYILSILLAFIFLSLGFLALNLYIKTKKTNNVASDSETELVENNEEDKSGNEYVWKEYVNNDYKYSLNYPKFLYKEELENEGGYLSFVRFSETEFTSAKGMGVGVRKDNLENEVARLKKDLEEEFDVELASEKNITVDGRKAILFEYKPDSDEELMAKNLIIVANNDYVYSISAVPEQMDGVIASFKFL